MKCKSGLLKIGDLVMVISGGNKVSRPIKGQVGKIKSFAGKEKDRVVVEGLNLFTKSIRAKTSNEQGRQEKVEGSIHISNVMFYSDRLKKPVKLKRSVLADGKKVRGYLSNEKEFVTI
jgi:large subunit ribosomal protein L24